MIFLSYLEPDIQEQFMSKFMVIILEVLKASEDGVAQAQLLHVFQILAENGEIIWAPSSDFVSSSIPS